MNINYIYVFNTQKVNTGTVSTRLHIKYDILILIILLYITTLQPMGKST